MVRAAASDDARPLLTGVLFTTDNGTLRLFATDSYRLAVRDVPGVEGIGDAEDLLVPARALQELQRAAASLPADAEIGVTLTDAEICFMVGAPASPRGSSTGTTRRCSNSSRRASRTSCASPRTPCSPRCKRAKLLAKDSTSSVRLTMKDRNLEIRTQSHDAGDVEDNVDADYNGEEMTIAFNPSFLIDGVEAVTGDEVVLEMSDAVRAAMVHGVEDLRFRYLLDARARPVVTSRRGPPRTHRSQLPALQRVHVRAGSTRRDRAALAQRHRQDLGARGRARARHRVLVSHERGERHDHAAGNRWPRSTASSSSESDASRLT